MKRSLWYSRCGYAQGFCISNNSCYLRFEGTLFGRKQVEACVNFSVKHPALDVPYGCFITSVTHKLRVMRIRRRRRARK